MLIQCPKVVLDCVQALQSENFEAYVVGGAVRDALMHCQTRDWDITTNARSDIIKTLFQDAYSLNPKFGTWCIQKKGYSIEITTFRTEYDYIDHRHPQYVNFCDDLVEDLKRRDFTMNAIAYDPVAKVLRDPFDGQKDIVAQCIKTVGSAMDRLSEDYLRILRAARFSSTLGFKISEDIKQTSRSLAQKIDQISSERIGQEFLKLFSAQSSYAGIDFCIKTQISDYLLKTNLGPIEFLKSNLDVPYKEIIKLLRLLNCDWSFTHARINHWAWPKTYKEQFKHLQTCLELYKQSKLHDDCMHDFFLSLAPLSLQNWRDSYTYLYERDESYFLERLVEFKRNTVLIAVKDLAITGQAIKDKIRNSEDYVHIKTILKDVLTKVRKKQLKNSPQTLLEYMTQHYAKILK